MLSAISPCLGLRLWWDRSWPENAMSSDESMTSGRGIDGRQTKGLHQHLVAEHVAGFDWDRPPLGSWRSSGVPRSAVSYACLRRQRHSTRPKRCDTCARGYGIITCDFCQPHVYSVLKAANSPTRGRKSGPQAGPVRNRGIRHRLGVSWRRVWLGGPGRNCLTETSGPLRLSRPCEGASADPPPHRMRGSTGDGLPASLSAARGSSSCGPARR